MEFTRKIFYIRKKMRSKYDKNGYICMESPAQIVLMYNVFIFYLRYNSSFIKGEKV